jgi:hypothetical protein
MPTGFFFPRWKASLRGECKLTFQAMLDPFTERSCVFRIKAKMKLFLIGSIGQPFLTSALDGGECSVSRPGRFTPSERALFTQGKSPRYPLHKGLDGRQSRSRHPKEQKKSHALRKSNPGCRVRRSSRYRLGYLDFIFTIDVN